MTCIYCQYTVQKEAIQNPHVLVPRKAQTRKVPLFALAPHHAATSLTTTTPDYLKQPVEEITITLSGIHSLGLHREHGEYAENTGKGPPACTFTVPALNSNPTCLTYDYITPPPSPPSPISPPRKSGHLQTYLFTHKHTLFQPPKCTS